MSAHVALLTKVFMGVGLGTTFVGTAYIVAIIQAPAPKYQVSDEQRRLRFEEIAPTYESKTRQQEFYLGIGRMRRRMLKSATGVVLEIGAGTGNNVDLYPEDQVSDVVMCDRAQAMVSVISDKIQHRLGYCPQRLCDTTETEPSRDIVMEAARRAQDAEEHGTGDVVEKPKSIFDTATTAEGKSWLRSLEDNNRSRVLRYHVGCAPSEKLPFPDNTFDTVVDVFGLCSFDDPVTAVKEMRRVCKPGGRILLLEHGRGTWGKINEYLDKWAPRHANSWGCWWNRDIRRYLRLSGASTISREQRHFGTTQLLVVDPKKKI